MALDFIKKNHSSVSLLFCNGEEKYDGRDSKKNYRKKASKVFASTPKILLVKQFYQKELNHAFLVWDSLDNEQVLNLF